MQYECDVVCPRLTVDAVRVRCSLCPRLTVDAVRV